MKAHILLIGLSLLITACGFHLRGSQTITLDLAEIYIHQSGAPLLSKQIQSQLALSGTPTASTLDSASYIVTLKKEHFEKTMLSVSASTGKVEEFLINYKVKMDIVKSDGKQIVTNDLFTMSRDITFDEDALLSKFSEEEILREDLVRRSSAQVLRRIQALISADKKK